MSQKTPILFYTSSIRGYSMCELRLFYKIQLYYY